MTRILIDTNILVPLLRGSRSDLPDSILAPLQGDLDERYVSVASFWEMAIKLRLGKLALAIAPIDLPSACAELGLSILRIEPDHAVADITPDVATRDPFDRLLLAQCAVEGLRLVTLDRALAAHPLAWR